MSLYVVDASVVAKWYVPEVHTEAAHRYLDPAHELIAPDLVLPETGNILWKKVRRGELRLEAGEKIIAAIREKPPIAIYPSAPLLQAAFAAAVDTARTVYDSLYVALAVAQQCQLVTADRKLFETLAGLPLGDHLRWIEEIPVTT